MCTEILKYFDKIAIILMKLSFLNKTLTNLCQATKTPVRRLKPIYHINKIHNDIKYN